jgi:chromosome segregation ATPase
MIATIFAIIGLVGAIWVIISVRWQRGNVEELDYRTTEIIKELKTLMYRMRQLELELHQANTHVLNLQECVNDLAKMPDGITKRERAAELRAELMRIEQDQVEESENVL